MKTLVIRIGVALAALALTACQSNPLRTVEVAQPLSARPAAAAVVPPSHNSGSIFQAASFQPLFEDHRARNVGDILTIVINENLQAQKQSGSTVKRDNSLTAAVPTINGFPLKTLQGLGVSGTASNQFAGKGDSSSSNAFTGTITVTVTEVLGNGNLIVAGEKQIGINQGSEFIRFSGVVSPATVVSGNTVSSTQVADARIEYRGTGYIDEAQTMGWLSRFFMSASPI